ncbi:indole-3-acetate beta-glucosyltransferase-like [Carex rostrata]
MAHVLILIYPIQGHINPMLQFAKDLASKGPKVTLVTTSYIITNSIKAQIGNVSIASISDGYDEGGIQSAPNLVAYNDSLEVVGSKTLAELIEKYNRSTEPFTCMVFDTISPWGDKVAQSFGLPSIAFSTQSCAVSAIYHQVKKGVLHVPEPGITVELFGLPLMERADFPSLAVKDGPYPTLTEVNLNQFNGTKDDWVLFNSFDELETEAMTVLKDYFHARAIGPCVPFLPRANGPGNTYGMSLLKPEDDMCMKWLNGKPANSVVYVSFGSSVSLTNKQMEELAEGLRSSGKYFLWVVRAAEQKTLPKGFVENPGDNGLVVTWSQQLKVLANEAIGCFLTHCGWNSTLEAICFGVPMLAIPQWTDQPTNAKFIEEMWGTGLRAKAGEEGFVQRDEVMRCVEEIMDGEKGCQIRENAAKWKELAKLAVSDGGSSDNALNEFVAYVNEMAEKRLKLQKVCI